MVSLHPLMDNQPDQQWSVYSFPAGAAIQGAGGLGPPGNSHIPDFQGDWKPEAFGIDRQAGKGEGTTAK